MSNFDERGHGFGDAFARHDPEFLERVYGRSDVVPFWVADMDFVVAEPIRTELQRIANRGRFAYETCPRKIHAAISGWIERRHGLALDSERFVQFPGVLTAIAVLIRQLTNEGDGILIQVPAYHQFNKLISTAGRRVVSSPLVIENGKHVMDLADLDVRLAADDVKVMILCNPHNPVGRVWRPDELEEMLQVAGRHGVTVISDEVHSDIIYPGHRFTSLMAVDPDNHVSVIGSPAKTFGMHSIANGFTYTGHAEMFERLQQTAESMYLSHGNAFSTFATIAAYEHGDAWVDDLLVYLDGTIDWIAGYLTEALPEIRMFRPEGTYQIWLDCAGTGLAGRDLVAKLAAARFGAAPGDWFDETAVGCIRVNIAAPRQDLKDAFERLKAVLSE